MAGQDTRAADRLEELYADLTGKAALDADATVRLIEALEAVFAGGDAGKVLVDAGLENADNLLTGLLCREMAGEVAALRGQTDAAAIMARIVALRDSLYRYQSFIS